MTAILLSLASTLAVLVVFFGILAIVVLRMLRESQGHEQAQREKVEFHRAEYREIEEAFRVP